MGEDRKSGLGMEATQASDAPRADLDTLAATPPPPAASGGDPLPEAPAGRYAVGAEIGRGGLGRILRARDGVLQRTVAVKELHAVDPGTQRRFVREALITARLQHPAIVPVYDAGRWKDQAPFYAMKLVAGRPLSDAIAAATTLEARLALLPHVLAVADAIAYAHRERIVHRDLKPGNVLVGDFGETVVIDWGLAKDLAVDGDDAPDVGPYREVAAGDHTVAGAVLGTPAYMPPEQAAGDAVDERADVYAIGAMLYHLIAGVIPHHGTTLDEVITRIVRGDITPLATREPRAPVDLVAIAAKAMATEPAARYPSARELADDLRRFQTGQLVGAHRYSRAERLARWLRRYRAVVAVAGVALVVLLGYGAWSVRRIVKETERADVARDQAVASAIEAARQRDEAVASANRAVLAQARAALPVDHVATLAWLKQLDPAGPGWSAARLLASDALARPRLVHTLDDFPTAFSPPVISPDRAWIAVAGPQTVWTSRMDGRDPRNLPLVVADDFAPTICDDNRRLIVRGAPAAGAPVTLQWIDLPTGTITAGPPDLRDAVIERARCAAAYALGALGRDIVAWDGAALHTIGTLASDRTGQWRSRDGSMFVTIEADGRAQRWTVAGKTGEVVVPVGAQRASTVSADGSTVALAGTSVRAARFDDQVVHTLAERSVAELAIAPDGSWIAVPAEAGDQVHLIALAPGRELRTLDSPQPIQASFLFLEVTDDGRWVVLGGHALVVWNVDAGDAVELHNPVPGGATTGPVVPIILGGDLLLTAAVMGPTIRVWQLPSSAGLVFRDALSGATLADDGRWFSGARDDAVVRVDLDDVGATERLAIKAKVLGVAPSGDVWIDDGTQRRVWSVGGATRVVDLPAERSVQAWLPDGTPIWLDAGAIVIGVGPLARRVAGEASVVGLEVSPDGAWLAVGTGNRQPESIDLIEVATLARHTLVGSTGFHAQFSADSRQLATGTPDGDLVVWDVATRRARTIGHGEGLVTAAGFLPGGRHVAYAGMSGIDDLYEVRAGWLHIVDLETGAASRRRIDALGWRRLAFAPAGDLVIHCCMAVGVVDVVSGDQRLLDTSAVAAVAARDDRLILATSGGVRIIDDSLPRDPAALAAVLAALPYRLNEDDQARVVTPP